jgi:hypothetical protein
LLAELNLKIERKQLHPEMPEVQLTIELEIKEENNCNLRGLKYS